MLSSDSPGTLSLSLPKSPSFLVTLQALVAKVTTTLSLSSDSPGSLSLAKVTKPFTQQKFKSHMQRNCNTLSHAAQPLSPVSLTLTTTVRNSIAYIYHISHTALGHRYFNLAVPCGICLRCAHASHKPASAFRLPNL